jgi:hypothetical protein
VVRIATDRSTAQEAHRVERSASHAHVLAAGAPGSVILPTPPDRFSSSRWAGSCRLRRSAVAKPQKTALPSSVWNLPAPDTGTRKDTNEEGATWRIRNS